jgi:hypothetical protein
VKFGWGAGIFLAEHFPNTGGKYIVLFRLSGTRVNGANFVEASFLLPVLFTLR